MNSQFKSYQMSKVISNGNIVSFEEQASEYDGSQFRYMENIDGKVKSATLNNTDLERIINKTNEMSGQSLMDKLQNDFGISLKKSKKSRKSKKNKTEKKKQAKKSKKKTKKSKKNKSQTKKKAKKNKK